MGGFLLCPRARSCLPCRGLGWVLSAGRRCLSAEWDQSPQEAAPPPPHPTPAPGLSAQDQGRGEGGAAGASVIGCQASVGEAGAGELARLFSLLCHSGPKVRAPACRPGGVCRLARLAPRSLAPDRPSSGGLCARAGCQAQGSGLPPPTATWTDAEPWSTRFCLSLNGRLHAGEAEGRGEAAVGRQPRDPQSCPARLSWLLALVSCGTGL